MSSLKAIYFTFSLQDWTPVESFDQTDYMCAPASKASATGARVMKTCWFCNYLANYQFFLDGKPTAASPVNVRIGFSENVAELARALHFGHKNGDGCYLSLLTDHGAYLDQNFVLGQEFETFSNKGPVIESGLNTLNSLMTLRLNFNIGQTYQGVPVVNGSHEACYLKVFCLYDNFLTITPGTGIMRTEM